jgi:hypothetical protein
LANAIDSPLLIHDNATAKALRSWSQNFYMTRLNWKPKSASFLVLDWVQTMHSIKFLKPARCASSPRKWQREEVRLSECWRMRP